MNTFTGLYPIEKRALMQRLRHDRALYEVLVIKRFDDRFDVYTDFTRTDEPTLRDALEAIPVKRVTLYTASANEEATDESWRFTNWGDARFIEKHKTDAHAITDVLAAINDPKAEHFIEGKPTSRLAQLKLVALLTNAPSYCLKRPGVARERLFLTLDALHVFVQTLPDSIASRITVTRYTPSGPVGQRVIRSERLHRRKDLHDKTLFELED